MALLNETQWHGNPRDVLSYAWTVFNGYVINPITGEQSPTYVHDVSPEPHATAATVTTTTNQGVIAEFAEVEFTGVVKEGDSISINWFTYDEDGVEISVRGAAGTYTRDCSPETAAMIFSRFINGNVDTQAAQAEGVAKIYGVNDAHFVNVGQVVFTPA